MDNFLRINERITTIKNLLHLNHPVPVSLCHYKCLMSLCAYGDALFASSGLIVDAIGGAHGGGQFDG